MSKLDEGEGQTLIELAEAWHAPDCDVDAGGACILHMDEKEGWLRVSTPTEQYVVWLDQLQRERDNIEEQANRMAGTLATCSNVMERWRDALEAIARDERSNTWASLMAQAALDAHDPAQVPW